MDEKTRAVKDIVRIKPRDSTATHPNTVKLYLAGSAVVKTWKQTENNEFMLEIAPAGTSGLGSLLDSIHWEKVKK